MRRNIKAIPSSTVPQQKLACISDSYDIIGDIAVIRLAKDSEEHAKNIAEAIMGIHRNVKVVLTQASPVQGDFRTRSLRHIAGEKRTVTTHMEHGCAFEVDVEKCYFSPRLSFERIRIAKQVDPGEVVVNMFAGVGCFSVLIARYSSVSRVYSIDINPLAVKLMQANIRTNRVYGKVVPLLGDAKETIERHLSGVANRVLMPLPEKALAYLPPALSALNRKGGFLHYYGFEHAGRREDPVEKTKITVADRLRRLGVSYEVRFGRVVRSTGPHWYQVVLDIAINSKVGNLNK